MSSTQLYNSQLEKNLDHEAAIEDLKKQVDIFLNNQKEVRMFSMNMIWKLKKLSEEINSHNSYCLLMEDELSTLQNNQVTLKQKITELQEDFQFSITVKFQ